MAVVIDAAYRKAYRAANLERLRAKERENGRRYRAENPEKSRASVANWYRTNKSGQRDYHLKHKYGISSAEYVAMMDAQGGMCALCGSPETRIVKGNEPRLCVDHDHKTGKVRGLLCWNCNVGIGKLRDDPSLMRAAAAYIERNMLPSAP